MSAIGDSGTSVDPATSMVLFSTPPTPNGSMHLGHLSGPYLAADVLHRRLSRAGAPVPHISGFDDHTSYVWTRSVRSGEEPARLTTRLSEEIRESWRAMKIDLEAEPNPQRDPDYQRFCDAALEKLARDGHVVAYEAEALHESDTGDYLHEGLVTGGCPFCGASADGDACEECGRPHESSALTSPRSTLRPEVRLELRSARRLYFPLEPHRRFLECHVRESTMSDSALALSRAMLNEPLPDIRLSHDVPWGLPVHVLDAGGTLYPWFEMGLLYLWWLRTRYGPGGVRIEDGQVEVSEGVRRIRIVHCFGFDNTYFHTLLFPALFHALDERLPVASDYVVNELLDLDGSKFSTSRDHVITVDAMLRQTEPDHVRLILAMIRPERSTSNFTLGDFARRVNGEVIGPLDDLMKRFVAFVREEFGGTLPACADPGIALRRAERAQEELSDVLDDALSIRHFSTQRAMRTLRALVAETTDLVATAERLRRVASDRDQTRPAVVLAATGLHAVRHHLAPIAPDLANRVAAVVGLSGPDALTIPPEGTVLGEWMPLPPVAIADTASLGPAAP